jgi:LysM repeat protein
VVAGDTLSEIAVKFHTTIANLKKLNRITDEDKILPGQVIKLK